MICLMRYFKILLFCTFMGLIKIRLNVGRFSEFKIIKKLLVMKLKPVKFKLQKTMGLILILLCLLLGLCICVIVLLQVWLFRKCLICLQILLQISQMSILQQEARKLKFQCLLPTIPSAGSVVILLGKIIVLLMAPLTWM